MCKIVLDRQACGEVPSLREKNGFPYPCHDGFAFLGPGGNHTTALSEPGEPSLDRKPAQNAPPLKWQNCGRIPAQVHGSEPEEGFPFFTRWNGFRQT